MARQPIATTPARGFGWEPGTMRKAGLVLGVLALLVAGGAWLGHEPSAKGPLDAYLQMGNSRGAAALQRDLLAETGPGGPLPQLLGRLRQLGLACPTPAAGEPWRCTSRLLAANGRRVLVQVVISASQNMVLAVTASFDDTANTFKT